MRVIKREGKFYLRWEYFEMSCEWMIDSICPVWNKKGELLALIRCDFSNGEKEIPDGAAYIMLPRRQDRHGHHVGRFPLYKLPSCKAIASFTSGDIQRTQIEVDVVEIPQGIKEFILKELSKSPRLVII